MAQIPLQDWFLVKPEAQIFLDQVAREIRWLATEDRFLERFTLLLKPKYVELRDFQYNSRYEENEYTGKRFFFRFELDRGRPHKGHTYKISAPGIMERLGSPNLEPIIFNTSSVCDITGENLLDAIRELCVMEVMTE
jgi:hypothetical protein